MEFYLLNSILKLKSGYKLSYNLILKWGTGRSLRSRPYTHINSVALVLIHRIPKKIYLSDTLSTCRGA